ncbi:Ig-like domain-containing protein [candidate division KSB1 bacterium]|nr:Ig-like domain-containing protein [candidate division KSB1 bacterium]NIR71596.1 Ig-like domain-containing protein [candidate division KSB1 bacterium]NIS23550.1 Ig-like domain-containing protein [candidate division KSB1 bacterium]NIT70473.1 Ig-like domain-containing protein [candidate division KSB1 bacterium]NIU24184.1 Ig-like domain-containing protein [candidate division KSB1 bacterium]
MRIQKIYFITVSLSCLILSCQKEVVGPQGPSAIEALSNPKIFPEVTWTVPQSGSIGPYPFTGGNTACAHPIIVQFNKFMDMFSVANAVKLLSDPAGRITLNFEAFRFLDGTKIEIKLYGAYEPGFTYRVIIDSTASDINGNHLQAPDTLKFLPEPFFRMTDASPPNQSVVRATQYSFSFYFNNVLNRPPSKNDVIIEPPIPKGEFDMLSIFCRSAGYEVQFFSNELRSATMYSMKFNKSLRDTSGNSLHHDILYTFFTEPFDIIRTSPADGDTSVQRVGLRIFAEFNNKIDKNSIEQAWSTTPPLTGTFEFSANAFVFAVSDTLLSNTEYTIIITTKAKDWFGDSLAAPFTFSFRTRDDR